MAFERIGVVGTSRKENERRVPIHPDHFSLVSDAAASRLFFEEGYGLRFGVDDDVLAERFAGVLPRRELLNESEAVILPKPLPQDLEELAPGGVLWGWPHCVQQRAITCAARERGLTLLAFEAMFTWDGGTRGTHLFYRNNEMAGYCGVLHAMAVLGVSGRYGTRKSAVVLSFGYVSRGAIHALKGLGVTDITVLTRRPPVEVRHRIGGCHYAGMIRHPEGGMVVRDHGVERPLLDVLAGVDIIVNGILQDTDDPVMYLQPGEEGILKPNSLIVDVSCDEGMGFPFARPTSFEEPTFRAGPATYYAVDHTPSYLWRSASWEISRVVVEYLERFSQGPEAWEASPVLSRAVEIREGKILNPKILTFGAGETSSSTAAEADGS